MLLLINVNIDLSKIEFMFLKDKISCNEQNVIEHKIWTENGQWNFYQKLIMIQIYEYLFFEIKYC